MTVGTWPPVLGIFEKSLQKGSFDEDMKLEDGSTFKIDKVCSVSTLVIGADIVCMFAYPFRETDNVETAPLSDLTLRLVIALGLSSRKSTSSGAYRSALLQDARTAGIPRTTSMAFLAETQSTCRSPIDVAF